MGEEVVGVFQSANLILIFLGLFVLVILFMGVKYSGKVEESDDLVLAGRGLSTPFLIPSILATWICAGAMMGAAGQAYTGGLQAVIWDPFAPVMMMLIVGFLFAHRLRKSGYTTVVDFMNDRFGKRMGMLYLVVQMLSAIGWLGGQLVALGVIVFLTTGFSMTMAILIAACVMIVVSYIGGLWALSRVDAIVLVLIIVGLLIMLPVVMSELGGWDVFFAEGDNWLELPTFAMFPVAAEDGGFIWYTGILGLAYYMSAWAALGLGDVPSQVILQRALAAKDEKVARNSFIISGFMYLIVGLMPVAIGIGMYTYGLDLPLDKVEMVLPWVADNFLPPWASVLFVVSLAGAIISTVGNTCLICATMAGHNLYRYFKPDATPKQELRMVRIAIPVTMFTALAIALYFETVYKLIVFSGALQLCTIFAPFVLGFFWKKANSTGAISAFVTGLVSWVIFFVIVFPYTRDANFEPEIIEAGLAMDWAIWDGLYISMVPAAIVAFGTMIVVSLATQTVDIPKVFTDSKGRPMTDGLFYWSQNEPD
jgi:solute:Na+ symporter, SSS family